LNANCCGDFKVDPICALQAAMEGFERATTEEAVTRAKFRTAKAGERLFARSRLPGKGNTMNFGHFPC
jgi:S-adenosylhomocysteine hydrolase